MDAPIQVPTDSEASIPSLLTTLNQQDEERHRRSGYAVLREVSRECHEERHRRSGYPVLREVSRDGHDELIHLRGPIPSHYLKQVAQAVVGKIEGGRLIINHIEVVAPTGGNSIGHRLRRATTTGGRPY